jgi:hypothetical protein
MKFLFKEFLSFKINAFLINNIKSRKIYCSHTF